MALSSIPAHTLGGDFFIACRAFHPLDHQTIVAPTFTYMVRPVVARRAHVCACGHQWVTPE
jgi:hypothetical protein